MGARESSARGVRGRPADAERLVAPTITWQDLDVAITKDARRQLMGLPLPPFGQALSWSSARKGAPRRRLCTPAARPGACAS
jgi:hypothetical protein